MKERKTERKKERYMVLILTDGFNNNFTLRKVFLIQK